MRRLSAAIFVAGMGFAACRSQQSSLEPTIFGGNPSTDFDEVVAVSAGVPCSGTWLGERRVLTAAHCIATDEARVRFRSDPQGEPKLNNAKVLSKHQSVDIAILCVNDDRQTAAATLPMAGAANSATKVAIAGWGEGSKGNPAAGVAKISSLESEKLFVTASPNVPCHGDSGGPAYAEGSKTVLGVFHDVVPSTAKCDSATKGMFFRVDTDQVLKWLGEQKCG